MVSSVRGFWAGFETSLTFRCTTLSFAPAFTTTLTRAQERPDDRRKEAEPIQNLHQQFNDLGGLESHVIDTTGQSVAATLEAVRRIFLPVSVVVFLVTF